MMVALDGDITETVGYDNTRCIICQETGGKLITVQFIKTGQRMLKAARNWNIHSLSYA